MVFMLNFSGLDEHIEKNEVQKSLTKSISILKQNAIYKYRVRKEEKPSKTYKTNSSSRHQGEHRHRSSKEG